MKLTLGDFKQQYARFTTPGACPDSELVVEKINEARSRIMACSNGNWSGTVGVARFCIDSPCLTLPREIQAIQAIALNGTPHRPRNQWYDLLPGGPGAKIKGASLNESIIDRGDGFCTFRDIGDIGAIKVYSSEVESPDTSLVMQGFGDNALRVRTTVDGVVIDGEKVAISNASPATSVTEWSYLSSVIKPKTNGFISIYLVNADLTETLLAIYHPDETVPSYKRYYIPQFDTEGQKWPVSLAAFVSFRYVPVYRDNDDLLITNAAALKQMLLCINSEEAGNTEQAKYYESSCFSMLAAEAARNTGPMAIEGPQPQSEGMDVSILEIL